MTDAPSSAGPAQQPVTVRCGGCGTYFRFDRQLTTGWRCTCGRNWTFAETAVAPADIPDEAVVQHGRIDERLLKPTPGAGADVGEPSPWVGYILFGLALQVVGAVVAIASAANKDLAGTSDPSEAGIIIGSLIGFLGTLVMLVGIIALGVHVGTSQLRDKVKRIEQQLQETRDAH